MLLALQQTKLIECMNTSPAYLGVTDKQNELHIFRVHRRCGRHLWSCSLRALALSHALLAFPFCSTRLHTIMADDIVISRHAAQQIEDWLSRRLSSAQQTCNCSLHRCGSLERLVEAGNCVPENAECCSLLQMAKTDVVSRTPTIGTYEQRPHENARAPARRQTSFAGASRRLQHVALRQFSSVLDAAV